MAYLNSGAYYVGTLNPVPTKAALKRAMRDEPDSVEFHSTTVWPDTLADGTPYDVLNGSETSRLSPGDKLQVTGPDPYRERKWYATVTPEGRVS